MILPLVYSIHSTPSNKISNSFPNLSTGQYYCYFKAIGHLVLVAADYGDVYDIYISGYNGNAKCQ